jgi:hypothetical protein
MEVYYQHTIEELVPVGDRHGEGILRHADEAQNMQ